MLLNFIHSFGGLVIANFIILYNNNGDGGMLTKNNYYFVYAFNVPVGRGIMKAQNTNNQDYYLNSKHYRRDNRTHSTFTMNNQFSVSTLNVKNQKNNDGGSDTTSLSNNKYSNTAARSQQKQQQQQQQPRRISYMEKYARLPVWPVWNGVLLFLLSKILPNSTIAKLEDQFGGRVCPNFFSERTGVAGDGAGDSAGNGFTAGTSPFIMLVHHVHSFTTFDPLRWFQKKVILPEGFPSHPHRGFITLTYCLRGGMVHRDSIGCKQSYGNELRHHGKFAQWLITGAGMLHEEMWDVNHEQDGLCSQQELFQIWINLPSTCKMDRPAVYLLSNQHQQQSNSHSSTNNGGSSDIQTGYAFVPIVESDDKKVETKVLAGIYNGQYSSNVPLESPMTILHVSMKENSSWSMKDIPQSYRTAIIYIRKGSLQISNQEDNEIQTHYTAYLTPYGDIINATSGKDGADFILLAGEPINEPIQARGSMVMNTFDEIDQAYNDYSNGRMGLPWNQDISDDEWRTHVNKYPSIYR